MNAVVNPAQIGAQWAIDRAAERCPLHGERLETARTCPLCEDCDTCGGEGVTVTRHPAWGRPGCPTDYDETECPACHGRGVQ